MLVLERDIVKNNKQVNRTRPVSDSLSVAIPNGGSIQGPYSLSVGPYPVEYSSFIKVTSVCKVDRTYISELSNEAEC